MHILRMLSNLILILVSSRAICRDYTQLTSLTHIYAFMHYKATSMAHAKSAEVRGVFSFNNISLSFRVYGMSTIFANFF